MNELVRAALDRRQTQLRELAADGLHFTSGGGYTLARIDDDGEYRAAGLDASYALDTDARLPAPSDGPRVDGRMPPASGGRIILASLVPWGAATVVMDPDGPREEWFQRGALHVPAHSRVPFVVGAHQPEGGIRVGWLLALINMPHRLDAGILIDDGPDGDLFLSEVVAGMQAQPQVSIAFNGDPGGFVDYPPTPPLHPYPQRQYRSATLVDIAAVKVGQYSDAATIWAWTDQDGLNNMLSIAHASK